MKTLTYHPLAVLAGIVLSQLIPVVWYGLLADTWMQLTGITETQAQTAGTTPYLIALVASVLSTGFMAFLYRAMRIESARDGALLGAGLGFFFGLLNLLTINAFEFRPLALSLIDGGMITLVGTGVGLVLGGWRKYREAEPAPALAA